MICNKKVKTFCCGDITKIENYDKAINDTTQTWHCHHRLEIHEDYRNSMGDLILMNLYYNRPPEELIFLTPKEHSNLHKLGYKHPHRGGFQSEQKRANCSKAHKGRKKKPFTEEHRRNLSKALKKIAITDEWRERMVSVRARKKYKRENQL